MSGRSGSEPSSRRSWLVLADGYLAERNAKTAHGVIRYSHDRIAAVLDRSNAGKTLADVAPILGGNAPIVATVREGLELGATSLLLGVATPGGWMPAEWRDWLREAIEAGMEIANGLHSFLSDDPELVALAGKHGAVLWDVRRPPEGIPLFTGRSLGVDARTVLTVGTDCAVGKMTVSLELAEAAHRAGVAAEFVATGQTGILIAGRGIAVDRVISDFVSGAAESLVVDADPASEVLIVEGQGSLWHPAYAGVTLGLLHGSAPEVLVLCHQAGRDAIEEPPYTNLPPLAEMVEVYERMAATVRKAKVACVAVNTQGLADEQYRDQIAAVQAETGLLAGDVLRGDADRLWDAVAAELKPSDSSRA
ncbi:MAG TPA: DUF1611 domain-containing protein [Actinomycetota bacterium]|nr:DUF1611 domain-containing protein [Actinomycetota bacterium]